MYSTPHMLTASAVFSGSFGSRGGGWLEVLTEQNRQPRVQVSPIIYKSYSNACNSIKCQNRGVIIKPVIIWSIEPYSKEISASQLCRENNDSFRRPAQVFLYVAQPTALFHQDIHLHESLTVNATGEIKTNKALP